jgi:predicted hydrocarbon binding protein
MIIRIYDNFFAQAAKSETGNPSCFFSAGVVAGIVDALFEEGHHRLERQCLASGADYCEFIVRRSPS